MSVDPKKINCTAKAGQAITEWAEEPPMAQTRKVKMAIETLELNQMYYEQKGNDHGVERMQQCLEILHGRKKELETGG